MPQKIEVPGIGMVEFPDGMSDAQIVEAIKKSTPSQAYEKGRNAEGELQGLINVMQGPTFGFADELIGAGGAAIGALRGKPIGESYRDARDFARGATDMLNKQNPIFSAVTQGAASLPIGGLFTKPAQATNAIATAAKSGAITGGLYGLGASTAEDLPGMALDTAGGAALGSAVSGVVGAGMRGTGAAINNVAQRFSPGAARSAAEVKVAEALARDARGNAFTGAYTPDLQAQRLAGTGIRATPIVQQNPALQTEARLAKLGPDAMIADAGGANTRQLLDTLAVLPGRTKETIANVQRQRMATEGGRLRGAADAALDTTGQRLSTTVQGLAETRATAAAPLYGQLRQINLNPSQELAEVVAAADQLGALGHARTLAIARQQPFTIDPSQPGTWNAGQLDHVKRGLDQLISRETKPDGTVSPVGAAISELRTRMVGLLDDATTNPQTGESLYRQARNAFAGPSALIDAANTGRRVLSSDDASITSALQGMSTSEVEAFRIGAYEALRNKLGSQAGRTELMNAWKNDSTREKLQALFGDNLRSYREFAAELAKEATKRNIQKVNTGSQTAARLAGMGDIDSGVLGSVASTAASAKAGNPLGVIAGARDAWSRVQLPQTTRDQMGALLMQQGPQAQQSLLRMRDLTNRINENNALLYQGTGLLGGNLIGTNIQPRGLLGM